MAVENGIERNLSNLANLNNQEASKNSNALLHILTVNAVVTMSEVHELGESLNRFMLGDGQEPGVIGTWHKIFDEIEILDDSELEQLLTDDHKYPEIEVLKWVRHWHAIPLHYYPLEYRDKNDEQKIFTLVHDSFAVFKNNLPETVDSHVVGEWFYKDLIRTELLDPFRLLNKFRKVK